MERPLSPDVSFRTPTEADHPRLARLLGEWWDDRPPRLERLWVRHFGATSAIAETSDGRQVGIALGFASQDVARRGVLSVVAVARAHRRQGIGRALVEEVVARIRAAGPVEVVEATVWPGNRVGLRFLEGVGFAPVPESLATPLYGVPAFEDYDGEGEDRALLELLI